MGRINKHVWSGDSSTNIAARAARLTGPVLLAAVVISAVACQVASAAPCANEALRSSLGSSLLADCRAYEMVTPPYKDGYPLVSRGVASNGEKIVLASFGGFADLAGSGEGLENNFYLDTRSAAGWRLSSMMAPLSAFVGQEPVAAEANDGMSLWYGHTPQQSAKTFELYVRSASGEYTRVGTLSPTVVSKEGEESDVLESTSTLSDNTIAATSTYQHVVLLANEPGQDYWSFDKTTGGHSLYEYSGADNERPVLVAARGTKIKRGEEEELIAVCGAELGGGRDGSTYNALSSDGETIFFTLSACNPSPDTDEVYARLHGSMTSAGAAESVAIGESECSEKCGGSESGGRNFEGASESGEKLFFTSTQKLTNDASDLTADGSATEEGGKPGCAQKVNTSGCNLYEYDFALEAGHRLTLVAGGTDDVRGVAGVAEDGSRIYYVADGVISGSGENVYKHKPTLGEPNLYMYDTDTGATSFIATLGSEDEPDWSRLFRRPIEVAGESGSFLLFASAALGITPNESSKLGVVQLFEYDAETGELVRVTQGEQVPGVHGEEGWDENGNGVTVGINPESIELVARSLGEESDFKGTTNRLNVSQDGKTIVFETAGELSPLAQPASTSAPACSSVYEFRSEGPISTGTVHLLSDGRDVPTHKREGCGAEYMGMDGSGNNILFATSDALLPSDVDGGQRNIYDARVDGGFPAGPVGGETTACEPGTCEGSVPGSAGLPGAAPSDAGRNIGTTGTFGLGTESKQTKKSSGGSSKRSGRSAGARRRVCRRSPKRERNACKASVRRSDALTGKGKKSRRGS